MDQTSKNILIYGVPFSITSASCNVADVNKEIFKLVNNPGSSSEGGSHPDFLKSFLLELFRV